MASQFDGPLVGTYWVHPRRLMAGPHPSVRDDEAATAQRIKCLLLAGITFFLDLTEPGEITPYNAVLPENVMYRQLSIQDMHVPTSDHMRRILDFVDAGLMDGRIVYVHCLGGIGRTGTVVGCHLVRYGMSGEVALKVIADRLHSGSPETEAQRRLVLRWCESGDQTIRYPRR
jgi:hypothetical protein